MPGNVEVQQVSAARLGEVIDRRIPRGLFLAWEDHRWVAVDNYTGDAWTEDFYRKQRALRWLRSACKSSSGRDGPMTSREIDRQAKLLRELRSIEAEVRAEITAVQGSLNAAMLIAKTHTLTGEAYSVTSETVAVPHFDQKNFKLVHPELYQQYTVSLAMRRLIIT